MTRLHLADLGGINSSVRIQVFWLVEDLPASLTVECYLVGPIEVFPSSN